MNFSHKQPHEVVNNYYHQRKQQQKCLSTQKSYKKKQNKTGSIYPKIDNDLMNSKYNQKQIYILQKTDSQKGKEDKILASLLNNEMINENISVISNAEKEESNNKKNIENTQQNDDKKKRQDKHYQNNTKPRTNSSSTPIGIETNASTLNTSSAPVTPTNTNNFKKQDNSNNRRYTNNSNNRRYTKRDTYNNEEGISKSNSRKSDEMSKSNSRNGYNKSDDMARTASKNGYSKKDEKSNQRNNNNKLNNNKTDGRNNKKSDTNRNNYYQRNNQGSNNKREDGPGFAEKEYGLTYEKLKDNSSNDLNLAAANKNHSYSSNVPSNTPNLQRRRSSAPELPFFFEQLSTDGGMMNNPNPINPSITNTPSVAANPANLNFNLINAAATVSNTATPNFANFPLNLNGLNGLNLLNGFNLLNGLNTFASPTTATPTTTTIPSNNINAVVSSSNNNSNANANNSNDNSKLNNNSTINGHGGRFNHLYAGPTFNNSPAASSLPMPNFVNRNTNDSNNGAASSSRLSRSFAEEYMKLPSQLYSSAEINNELSKNYVADDLVLYSKNYKKDDLFFNNPNGFSNFNEDLFMRRDISDINTQNIVSGLSGLRNTSTGGTATPNKRNSYAEEVFAMDDEYNNSSNSPTKTKSKSHEDENLKRKSMELLQYLSSSVAANSTNSNNTNNDEAQKVQSKTNANQTSAVSSIKIRSYNNSSTSSTSSSYTNTNTTLINSNEDNSIFSTTPNSFYSPANKNMNSSLAPVISATTDVLSSSENSNSTLSLEQISQNLKNILKIN
ncbi:hypothetical protein BCR36DRAFT_586335 [Piromyces finnis]|uniref:Uncharacterized protein n=1 Tax=Piromyces finnis TaxID=1754191 RepID=A0A1Y1UZQ7_9FUNG|nr:hypothetical protein BCR36DRAFT_586335 [Piromyces finnis]|eukprot:ORX44212.1 hypothetical protein BCR36DRAFT_586335 [Piromyces finnis]